MPLADEYVAAAACAPDHLFGGKLSQDILSYVIQPLHGIQAISSEFGLQEVGADYMDAVLEVGKYFRDRMRLTDTSRSDNAYPSFAERHVV